MIVRTTQEITGTDRDIESEDGNWRSKRIILGGDKVGFSFHETTIQAGTVNNFHYANHVEAVWLIEGEGTLTDRETGETYELVRDRCTCSTDTSATPSSRVPRCACCACSIPRSSATRRTTRTACTPSSRYPRSTSTSLTARTDASASGAGRRRRYGAHRAMDRYPGRSECISCVRSTVRAADFSARGQDGHRRERRRHVHRLRHSRLPRSAVTPA